MAAIFSYSTGGSWDGRDEDAGADHRPDDNCRQGDQAQAGLRAGLERMARFYADTDGWLTGHDHNHLRITRIIAAARTLLGPADAAAFHAKVMARTTAAGGPVNPVSLRYWNAALG